MYVRIYCAGLIQPIYSDVEGGIETIKHNYCYSYLNISTPLARYVVHTMASMH